MPLMCRRRLQACVASGLLRASACCAQRGSTDSLAHEREQASVAREEDGQILLHHNVVKLDHKQSAARRRLQRLAWIAWIAWIGSSQSQPATRCGRIRAA